MRRIAILLLLPLAAAFSQDESVDLLVERVRLRLGGAPKAGRFRDSLRLNVRFRVQDVPLSYHPANDGITVALGEATVLSLPPLPEGARLQTIGPDRYRYREKGRARCRIDLASGRIKLKVRGLDLSSALTEGSQGVPVTLLLGGLAFGTTVDLEERGRSYSYRAPITIPFFRPRDPIPPGPDPDPDPVPPANFRVLLTGNAGDVQTPLKTVFRTKAEFENFWFQHPGMWPPANGLPPAGGAPIVPPPIVDWTKEMVAGVFLGTVLGNSYSVTVIGVREEGTGLVVTYRETQPGPTCPQPMIVGYPFVIAAVPKATGPVSFQRTVLVQSCP